MREFPDKKVVDWRAADARARAAEEAASKPLSDREDKMPKTSDVAQEAGRLAASCSDAESALVDIGEKLRKATGSDPETARAISQAAEHARALVTALTQISGKAPRGLVVGTLRPMLEPLVRLLDSEGDDADDTDEGRG